jgi:malonyl-CoA O-methyltransferase
MTELHQAPPSIDPQAAKRYWRSTTITSSWLNDEVGQRMHDRLQWIRLQPKRWLDWMALTGSLSIHRQVQQSYPGVVDYVYEPDAARHRALVQYFESDRWWLRVLDKGCRWLGLPPLQPLPINWRADALEPPFDMVWANMSLHMTSQPQQWLSQWCQALRPDGFLMFSCCGPDTLIELRQAYAERGWNAPTHEFTDMHDWGDMLVHAGFAEPVMDMEKITVTYSRAEDVLRDLRSMGRNLSAQRFQGLRGRDWLAQFKSLFEQLRQQQGGDTVRLSFEIIYGHAIKPVPKLTVSSTTTVSLDQMKNMLHRSID